MSGGLAQSFCPALTVAVDRWPASRIPAAALARHLDRGPPFAAIRNEAILEWDRKGNSSVITMYTTSWCGYCVRLKHQLQQRGLGFTEVDIEQHPEAAEFVGSVNGGNHVVPTLRLPDGSTMTNPGINEVVAALG